MNKSLSSCSSLNGILREQSATHNSGSTGTSTVQFNCEEQENEEIEPKSWWAKWKVTMVAIIIAILTALTIGLGVFYSDKPTFYPYCNKDDFHCPSNGLCLSIKQLCDGVYDCNSKRMPTTWQFESWEAENFPELADEMGCYPPYCSAHDFQCADGNCVSALRECDNTTDCADKSDEIFCPIQPLPNGCGDKARDFPCGSVQSDGCVPRHFICNGLRDCRNGKDEENCALPNITKPPVDNLKIRMNQSFTISCEAQGIPTPFIRWRHNLSHVPHQCHATTLNGKGTLTCKVLTWDDFGNYFCQAVNTFGSVFSFSTCQVHV